MDSRNCRRFLSGLAVGDWRALVGAVAFGVWAGLDYEGEIAGWFMGVLSGLMAAVPIMAGLVARKMWTHMRGEQAQAHRA
jgi:hypothetical protein